MKKVLALLITMSFFSSYTYAFRAKDVTDVVSSLVERKLKMGDNQLTGKDLDNALLKIQEYRAIYETVQSLNRGNRLSATELKGAEIRCKDALDRITARTWLLQRRKLSKRVVRQIQKKLELEMGSADKDFYLRRKLILYKELADRLLERAESRIMVFKAMLTGERARQEFYYSQE